MQVFSQGKTGNYLRLITFLLIINLVKTAIVNKNNIDHAPAVRTV